MIQLSNEIIGFREHKNYLESLKKEYSAEFSYYMPRRDIIILEAKRKLPEGFMDRIFRKYGVTPISLV